MKKRKMKWMAGVSLALSGMLALGDVILASAESVTYGQYLSGGESAQPPKAESEYTVIAVSTEEDLRRLAEECGLDTWSRDKYVKLENDIVLLDGDLMIPSFGGIFDGGGHKVSGLEITAAGSCVGLFRYVQAQGVVRNLTVSGKVAPGGSASQAGLVAGVNYGRIQNCTVSGTVRGAEKVGGLAGVNEGSGEIRGCSSAAMVSGDHCTGGICGSNQGTLNNCSNSGSVNTYSVDVPYGIEDITMEGLEERESLGKVAVHTDTGGIAGYSEGKIYYCSNEGTVGYQHVGYNTGGIVGRLHQGYLQNCTNTGHVLGRKDVGGIAGQMEPFLEIQYLNDKLGEIDREADVFFDLLEAAQEDLDGYGDQARNLARSVGAHVRNASDAAGNLTGAANDLWYIYNQELTGISNDLSRLNQEWANQAEADGSKTNGDKIDSSTADRDQTDSDKNDSDSSVVDGSVANMANVIDSDGSDRPHLSVSGGDMILPDNPWDGELKPDFQADLESYLAALRRFGEGVSGHLGNMTDATSDRSGGIHDNLEILDREMEAAGEDLGRLADVLEEGSDRNSANVDALIAQAKTLRRCMNELRDDLFRYEGIAVEDDSDEAAGGDLENLGAEAYYDTSSFQQGKITLSINKGIIEADTNVGGIVGQVATEVDFDPEDDISVSGTESFNMEQTVKAVIRESRNLGDVTGKKDYVGGIVGKADHGAVVSCESYGTVESTGGSYVGGIAGASGYCVRSCSSMGALSGKDYVGGIAGSGCDIFYSYAYPELEYSGECAGAIAGTLEEEGVLYGNYYVKGNVPGVDSIGYQDGAAPLEYGEFCSLKGVPGAFSEFTVSFQADGKELAAFRCGYGEALDMGQIPEVPEKEGYYGVWPEFDYGFITGNKVLEARYEKWVTSLASRQKDESGRSLVLVQGRFLPKNRLELVQEEAGFRLSVSLGDEGGERPDEYNDIVTVRALSAEEGAVAEVWKDGTFKRTASKTVGSYLEFSMEVPGTFRITVPEGSGRGWAAPACMAAGVVGAAALAAVLVRRRRKRKGKK